MVLGYAFILDSRVLFIKLNFANVVRLSVNISSLKSYKTQIQSRIKNDWMINRTHAIASCNVVKDKLFESFSKLCQVLRGLGMFWWSGGSRRSHKSTSSSRSARLQKMSQKSRILTGVEAKKSNPKWYPKPYNKMRIPFLEQRRGIQRKTKALIDGTFLKICVHVYVCRQRK